MTLGDLFEEHYNYKKDKVKLTTLSNYGKKIKHFNSIRNIKWNCSIEEIDKQLFKRFKLSEEEINYINENFDYMD